MENDEASDNSCLDVLKNLSLVGWAKRDDELRRFAGTTKTNALQAAILISLVLRRLTAPGARYENTLHDDSRPALVIIFGSGPVAISIIEYLLLLKWPRHLLQLMIPDDDIEKDVITVSNSCGIPTTKIHQNFTRRARIIVLASRPIHIDSIARAIDSLEEKFVVSCVFGVQTAKQRTLINSHFFLRTHIDFDQVDYAADAIQENGDPILDSDIVAHCLRHLPTSAVLESILSTSRTFCNLLDPDFCDKDHGHTYSFAQHGDTTHLLSDFIQSTTRIVLQLAERKTFEPLDVPITSSSSDGDDTMTIKNIVKSNSEDENSFYVQNNAQRH